MRATPRFKYDPAPLTGAPPGDAPPGPRHEPGRDVRIGELLFTPKQSAGSRHEPFREEPLKLLIGPLHALPCVAQLLCEPSANGPVRAPRQLDPSRQSRTLLVAPVELHHSGVHPTSPRLGGVLGQPGKLAQQHLAV
jgi:hypothetical protein